MHNYVHVDDLVNAHVKVLGAGLRGWRGRAYDLGTGTGLSVKQVIDAVEKVTGKKVSVKMGERRAGVTRDALRQSGSDRAQARVDCEAHGCGVDD